MDQKFIKRWSKIIAMKAIDCSDAACAAELGKTKGAFKKRWAQLKKRYNW